MAGHQQQPVECATLRFTCAGNIPAGLIKVVGAADCLGSWCPLHAPEAVRDDKDRLELTVYANPSSQPIGYRLMVADAAGKFSHWERHTDRELVVTEADIGHVIEVQLEWGQALTPRQVLEAASENDELYSEAAGSSQEMEETEQDWGWSEEEIYEYQKSISWKNSYLSPMIVERDTIHPEVLEQLENEHPEKPGQMWLWPGSLVSEGKARLKAEQTSQNPRQRVMPA